MANAVYEKMDQLYQGKMYFPGKGWSTRPGAPPCALRLSLTSCLLPLPPSGYFPNELRAIFREQVHLIQNAIIESEPMRAGEGGCCPGPRGPRATGAFESPSTLELE